MTKTKRIADPMDRLVTRREVLNVVQALIREHERRNHAAPPADAPVAGLVLTLDAPAPPAPE